MDEYDDIDYLADVLIAAVERYDEAVAEGHIDADDEIYISVQKYSDRADATGDDDDDDDGDDEAEFWWKIEISDSFEHFMTNWDSGDSALKDVEAIRAGNALDVACKYDSTWDDAWTEVEAA